MKGDWYEHEFGDRENLALGLSLGSDPHPVGDAVIDATWGSVSLWVRGRCLTRNVSSTARLSDEVRWNLDGLLRWALEGAIRLVNEEPFPDGYPQTVRDACEWFERTEEAPGGLTDDRQDGWYLGRSVYYGAHALRAGIDDAAFPQIFLRRLGDFLEVSWDNVNWPASRPDVAFIEPRGTELVDAARAAATLGQALCEVTKALAEHSGLSEWKARARAAEQLAARRDDWRWLVHAPTARAIAAELPDLALRLARHTQAKHQGVYVPHTVETLLLRQAGVTTAADIEALLRLCVRPSAKPLRPAFRRLIHPQPAPAYQPWKQGYQLALDVRAALQWGTEAAPNLDAWLTSHHVDVHVGPLPSAIDLLATRSGTQAMAAVSTSPGRRRRREMGRAAALGHILFDPTGAAVDGPWEHGPSAARARAFAAMLMLPTEGVRDALGGKRPDASRVEEVMKRFGTGAESTAYHLRNLGFIESDDRRDEILGELAA